MDVPEHLLDPLPRSGREVHPRLANGLRVAVRPPPLVRAFDADTGKMNFEYLVAESTFRGGVSVGADNLAGDVSGDRTSSMSAMID